MPPSYPIFLLFILSTPTITPSPIGCSNYLPCWKSVNEMVDMATGKDTERYNCSSKTASEWLQTGEHRAGWSIYYLVSAVVFQIIGWPVIYVFVSPNMANKVFGIMAFIGVIEITEVWGVSGWAGWAAWKGDVYCSNRVMATIVGKITMVQWITGTTSALFLGIHRYTELTKKGLWLHDSTLKTSLWLSAFTLYGIFGSVFYDTVLFNSRYMAPLLDPMILENSPFSYSNEFLRYHNCAVSAAILVVYTTLTWTYLKKGRKGESNRTTKMNTRVLIQSICLSLTYIIPALSFVLIYFITNPPYALILISDLTYQLSGGLPFVMYILVNSKIRRELLVLVRLHPGDSTQQIRSANTVSSSVNHSARIWS